jgi:hypothetical protein
MAEKSKIVLKMDFFLYGSLLNICGQSMTHFLASHEKMCQISYKISLFWMATMVPRKMGHTLGTNAIKGFNLNFLRELLLSLNKFKSKRGTNSV